MKKLINDKHQAKETDILIDDIVENDSFLKLKEIIEMIIKKDKELE